MNIDSRTYNSKILLIGEYTVLLGSKALAIPFPKYNANWKYDKQSDKRQQLVGIKNHLLSLHFSGQLLNFDFDDLEYQMSRGLYLESNIPIGYGLGSSGSVAAALYNQFQREVKQLSIEELKTQLSLIEAYYHGTSSGIDPLVAYLNQPILISEKDKIELLDIQQGEILGKMYLLDTKIPRQTSPLVKAFMATYDQSDLFKKPVQEILRINNNLIDYYLAGDFIKFKAAFANLSYLQYQTLKMLIPDRFHQLWRDGIDSNAFDMKLCGAGGGGFLIVMVHDQEKTFSLFEDFSLISIID